MSPGGSPPAPGDTRVLVVDDMSTMRKLVCKYLGDLGFTHIVQAEDGRRAWDQVTLALVVHDPFGLVVSDFQMPNMTGIELLRKIRSLNEMRTTPFVMLTAEADKGCVVEVIKAGATNYVVKPFTPETFTEKITAAMSAAKG